jgi:hypothetical protein
MINIKKQKEKFLEHYFTICREHGFCIDWQWCKPPEFHPILCVEDWPQYEDTFVSPDSWEKYKKELLESIDGE